MTPQDDKTKCDATNYLGSALLTLWRSVPPRTAILNLCYA